MRSAALGLALLLSSFPAPAQSGASSEAPATALASPLDGNWQITGNSERKQYPAISMFVHVNGRTIVAAYTIKFVCFTGGTESKGTSTLSGEIEPDDSFTLRPLQLPNIIQLTIVGKVPPARSTSWDGTYTVEWEQRGKSPCVMQRGSFTSSPMPALAKAFSGHAEKLLPWPPLQGPALDYFKRTPHLVKVSIAVAEGEPVFKTRPRNFAYLPLSGTIEIGGCPCFTHGTTVGDGGSRIAGERLDMRFKMDDESELVVIADYTSPETGLSFNAFLTHGKCAGLAFVGKRLLP